MTLLELGKEIKFQENIIYNKDNYATRYSIGNSTFWCRFSVTFYKLCQHVAHTYRKTIYFFQFYDSKIMHYHKLRTQILALKLYLLQSHI